MSDGRRRIGSRRTSLWLHLVQGFNAAVMSTVRNTSLARTYPACDANGLAHAAACSQPGDSRLCRLHQYVPVLLNPCFSSVSTLTQLSATGVAIQKCNVNRRGDLHGGMICSLVDTVGSLALSAKGLSSSGASTDIHTT